MSSRLRELLKTEEVLYGVICRDTTMTDLELMAQLGYSVVFLDLEHGPQSTAEVLRLGRTIAHLGMVPMARIPELTRTQVQRLLDGGTEILTLPDVRSAAQAARLVQLGKFPPLGERGVSSSSAGTGFTLGSDPRRALGEADLRTSLMVMIESDEGYQALDDILGVEGIDMLTVGEMDWSVSLGLFGPEAKRALAPKIERVLEAGRRRGKILSMGGGHPQQALQYRALGVRLFFVGVDVNLKRKMLSESLSAFRGVLG